MSKTKEEILGPPCYPHECGSMVEVQPHQDALKAIDEFARQSVEEYKKRLIAQFGGRSVLTPHQAIRIINEL